MITPLPIDLLIVLVPGDRSRPPGPAGRKSPDAALCSYLLGAITSLVSASLGDARSEGQKPFVAVYVLSGSFLFNLEI